MTEFQNHLIERGLTDKIRCYIEWERECVRFPIWERFTGKLIGRQNYHWKADKTNNNFGRYNTQCLESYRTMCVWGWDCISNKNDTLYVVEGIWDAIRVINTGRDCVAVLGAGFNRQFIDWFRQTTSHLDTVALIDNDGNRDSYQIAKLTQDYYPVFNPYKDCGDMTASQCEAYLSDYER